MKDKTFLSLSILFFLLFFMGIGVLTLDKPVSRMFLRASNVNPSSLKSFAIVFPQVTSVSSTNRPKNEMKVTATIRDVNGTILADRKIQLNTSLSGTLVSPSELQTTDQNGQAVFYLSSSLPGKGNLTITDLDSNTQITNIPSVEFVQ